MQTISFVREFDATLATLRVQPLLVILKKYAPPRANQAVNDNDKLQFAELLMSYYNARPALTPDQAEIAKALSLIDIAGAPLIADSIKVFVSAGSSSQVWSNFFLYTLFAKLDAVDGLRQTLHRFLLDVREKPTDAGEDSLTLEVMDYDGRGVSLRRLREVTTALDKQYEAVAMLVGAETTSPRIRYVDTGSKLVLSLAGIAPVVTAMRDLFLAIWNGLLYRRNDRFERNLRSAEAAKNFVASLRLGVAHGELSTEDAEKLERQALNQAQTLLGAGVMISDPPPPEFESPASLLASVRDVRLLGVGEGTPADAQPDEHDQVQTQE